MCALWGSIQPSSALREANDVADYIGCFKPRDNADNRLRLRTHRWYDPHWELFEGDSSKYAEGPFYIIHGSIIDGLVRSGLTVRMGGPNEGQPPTSDLQLIFRTSAGSCCFLAQTMISLRAAWMLHLVHIIYMHSLSSSYFSPCA